MSTTRFAIKAFRGLRSYKKISSVNDLPPSITAVFKKDPRNRQLFENLLERVEKDAHAEAIRRKDDSNVPLLQEGYDGNMRSSGRVVPNVRLNIPLSDKTTEQSIKNMLDPKLRVFEEWKKVYTDLVDSRTDIPQDLKASPLTMALDIASEMKGASEQRELIYEDVDHMLDDYSLRSDLMPDDFNSEKRTPTESEMYEFVKSFINVEEKTDEKGAKVKETGKAAAAVDGNDEASLAFEIDEEEEAAEEEEEDEDDDAMVMMDEDIAAVALPENRKLKALTEVWDGMGFEQKKRVYNYIQFVKHSEYLARDELRKKRQEATNKMLDTLRQKVVEMKNIKKRDYQLPEHDYEIVFLDQHMTSWKSRSQDERGLLEIPITIMKRQLESMAEKMTLSANDETQDPAAAMKEFNKFERVLNVFLSRAMGAAIGNKELFDMKPMEIPTDVLPDNMQWERLPFHHRLNSLYDAVVERSEPVEKYADKILKLQTDIMKPNQGRAFNMESVSKYPKQFEIALQRLHKNENKKMRALEKRSAEHFRAQTTKAFSNLSFGDRLSSIMSMNSIVQEIAENLEMMSGSLPGTERMTEIKKLITSQRDHWNETCGLLCSEYPELQPVVDMLSVTMKKLDEQRNKMADIDAQVLTEEIRSKHFPDGKSIHDLHTEETARNLVQNEQYSKMTEEQYKESLFAEKQEVDELRSVFDSQSAARLQLAQEYDEFLSQTLSKDKYSELLHIVDQVLAKAQQNKVHVHLYPHLSDVKRELVEAGTGAFLKKVQMTEKQLTTLLDKKRLTDQSIQDLTKEFGFNQEMSQLKDIVLENVENKGLMHAVTPAIGDRLLAINKKYNLQTELPPSKKDYLKNDPNRHLKPKRVLETVTTMGQVHAGMKYPGDNKVKLHVNLKDLKLSDKARERLLAIVGSRYNPSTNVFTLRGDVLQEKSQNIAYVERLLVELIKEAQKADEDEAYEIVKQEVYEPTPLELLASEHMNTEEEQKQSEEALEVWKRIRKTGKVYVGADQTYGEGEIDEVRTDKGREMHQNELGYTGAVDEDDEGSFLLPESTFANLMAEQQEEKGRKPKKR